MIVIGQDQWQQFADFQMETRLLQADSDNSWKEEEADSNCR